MCGRSLVPCQLGCHAQFKAERVVPRSRPVAACLHGLWRDIQHHNRSKKGELVKLRKYGQAHPAAQDDSDRGVPRQQWTQSVTTWLRSVFPDQLKFNVKRERGNATARVVFETRAACQLLCRYAEQDGVPDKVVNILKQLPCERTVPKQTTQGGGEFQPSWDGQ